MGKAKELLSVPQSKKILIVDDDPLITLGLEKVVIKEGFAAVCAHSGSQALRKIEEENPDIVLLDLKLPDSLDGLALLEIIKKSRPEIQAIMISGQSEIRAAVDAMKAGALDYLEKPIDFGRFKALLGRFKDCGEPAKKSTVLDDLIYVSDKMKRVVETIERLAAKSDITVLMLGESGTGKNFLCRKMHEMSPRKGMPYVQIGCANIPDHLIESELFGYEKGAFTDAKQSKEGLVGVAEGGTLLLDEIGEMPYPFQAKILTLLEEKQYRKVGALQDSMVNVRILAATNRNLHQQVQDKKFRLDLYYRLNVATIELPSLRERPEDVAPLVDSFLANLSRKYDSPLKTVGEEGMELLQEYSWPGNIRQLKNLLERLVVISDKEKIDYEDISSTLLVHQQMEDEAPIPTAGLESGNSLSLNDMEEKYIRTALKLAGGNQRRAAKLLNISRDTLRYRLKKMGL